MIIRTLPHLKRIRLVSVRSSPPIQSVLGLVSVRSSLPCINIGVRIELPLFQWGTHRLTTT